MAEKFPAIIVTKNDRLRVLLEAYLKEFDGYFESQEFSDSSELYNTLSSLSKSVLIVDFDDGALGEDFIKKVVADAPECVIVAVKENPEVDFIVKTVSLGVKEILSYPLLKDEFVQVMKNIYLRYVEPEQKPNKCKMITVFSNKGGIGKTSIACNLAFELAKITKENVALIDLNFQLGDITTFMNLSPNFDISYMLNNSNTLNKDFLLSTMEKYKNTSLYVLADPPYFKQAEGISKKQISNLIKALKETFSYIVVDTDANFDDKTITALDYSDLVFLVTIVNLPALRNCQRCLDLFEKLGYPDEKIQVLINRYMENDEISVDDVVKLLKKQIYWKIPNNYFALMASINKGVLLSELNSSSNVAQSYRDLAMHVSDSVFRNNLLKKFAADNMNKLDGFFGS